LAWSLQIPLIPHCVKSKYGYIPLGLCSKLRTWKISPRQVDRVVNNSSSSSTVEFVDTYTTIDESWLFTTSWSTVTIFNSITVICCGFVVQLVSTVDKILTDSASRGPSALAEILVKSWP